MSIKDIVTDYSTNNLLGRVDYLFFILTTAKNFIKARKFAVVKNILVRK